MEENETVPSDLLKLRADSVLMFLIGVVGHWKALITGGFVTGVLWVLQGVGWLTPPHWLYWAVALFCLLAASYQAWDDQYCSAKNLAQQLRDKSDELDKRADETTATQKRDLIRVVTALRTMESKVRYWRDITNGRWGMSPSAESFTPHDMHHFFYLAEQVEPNLRVQLEKIAEKSQQAESCIREFKSQPVNFQQERLMKQAYTQLDEVAPLLSGVISELAAFERRLGKP